MFLFAGNFGVGKTSLVQRFMADDSLGTAAPTLSLDFRVKRLEIDKQRVRLHVWDTAGQERFDSLSYKYYRGANGVLLVYDISTRKSFDDITMWLENIRKHCHQDINAVLVGNKCDLKDRQVPSAEAEKLADELHMPYFETSATENIHVHRAYLELVKSIMGQMPFLQQTPRYLQSDQEDVQKILCTCCSWNSNQLESIML